MKSFFALIFVFLSLSALADGNSKTVICQKYLLKLQDPAAKKLNIGDLVTLEDQHDKSAAPQSAFFLGRVVDDRAVPTGIAIYEYSVGSGVGGTIRVLRNEDVRIARVKKTQISQVIGTRVQEGETCGVYSIANGFRQICLRGYKGDGNMPRLLSAQDGMDRLLEWVLLNRRVSTSVIFASYGYEIYRIPFWNTQKSISDFIKYLGDGWPILVSYGTSRTMAEPGIQIQNEITNEDGDERLWLPKSWWQWPDGRHSVLALATFEVDGKTKVLISDPNWPELRVWDIEYLNKMRGASIQFEVIWEQ